MSDINDWHKFLNRCEVDNSELFEGSIDDIIVHEATSELKICIIFPKVVSFESIRLLITDAARKFCRLENYNRIYFQISYQKPEIDSSMIKPYYEDAIDKCSIRNRMVDILKQYPAEFSTNRVTITVPNDIEERNIKDVLEEIKIYFSDFGLNFVEFNTQIDAFMPSIIDRHNLRRKIEKDKYDAEFQEQQRQRQSQVNQNSQAFKESKSHIDDFHVRIQDLPVKQEDVMEFKQSRGSDKVIVRGILKQMETRKIVSKNTGKSYNLFTGVITNYVDSVTIKRFYRDVDEKFFSQTLKLEYEIEVTGSVQKDDFAQDVIIMADKITMHGADTLQVRFDDAKEKRVELHAHTKMSVQDSALDVDKYCQTAKKFGHKALAVTDHNNCHVLPDFFKNCKKLGIKPIAGLEGCFIDEKRYKIALTDESIDLTDATFVVFDIETTGLRNNYDDIIEIGAVKIKNNITIDEFSSFVKPNKEINSVIENITNIHNSDVERAPAVKEVLEKFIKFVDGAILVAHNATFDRDFIIHKIKKLKMAVPSFPCIDTMQLARILYGGKLKQFSLEKVARHLKVTIETQHRALSDSITTSNFFKVMLGDLADRMVTNYNQINQLIDEQEAFKYVYPKHITLLVKNKVGLKNFYKIISDSQTTHFYREPRILKSILNKYRDGLLVGSSCSNGEIFRLAYEKSYEDVLNAIDYYDYIEIQPLECYRYLIDLSGEQKTSDYIVDAIKKIIKAAKLKNKIIVATGDVHHLSKEDVGLRDIYVNVPLPGGGLHPLYDEKIKEIPNQPFLTTTEMLEAFNYLPSEDAYEYVVTNTNKIADMIEEFPLFPDKLFVPRDSFLEKYGIPSMSEGLRNFSYNKAREFYGENLPKYVEDRLELELNSIIGNGYASVYYISHMLVKKSNDSGYVVGSRGSVGSSFVATMMGITEVNPLIPHYNCPKCHFTAFKYSRQDLEKYSQDIPQDIQAELDKVDVGFDLPKKYCPKCGTLMRNDGIDIAFQTFLGFKGDKTPDIDLNFSGEYQERAHLFVREMFGYDYAFRAGTVSSIAEKTAYGFVKGYLERKNKSKRQAEISRIADSIAGAKKTTGQHPGGIVVVPDDIEYTDITPVQYPADDVTATWRTTHYDYHSFESNLLKLDILGHDDPTMIKALMDYVHQNQSEFSFSTVEGIPFIDKDVISLFSSKDALHLQGDDNDPHISGTVGVPEFGTNFVREMLDTIKPSTYADIIKVSGLAHGTNVWLDNAYNLVTGTSNSTTEKIPFKEVIGCRDDIMIFLLKYNLPSYDAFSIMEAVRKGKGLTEENEKLMREYKVPNWFIDSCKKIKYLFPKAHATAYVIMALRIGWFKVHRPIYYYAVYFSKRAKAFDVETFVSGRNGIKNLINDIEKKDDRKNKEEDLLDELKIALEMVLRGYTFKQIDINISEAVDFVISADKKSLYLPFSALDALGESAAKTVVDARRNMPFTSIEDVEKRTKLNKTQLTKLKVLGAFGNLPEKEVNHLV